MTEVQDAIKSLSQRELEVLRLMAAFKRNVDIAKELGVLPRTISQFKARAAKKLGLDHPSDYELIETAKKFGALNPPLEVVPSEVTLTLELPADIFEIASDYPGKMKQDEWERAEPHIRNLMAQGVELGRLQTAAIMYRRQRASLGAAAPPLLSPEQFFGPTGPWAGSFPMPAYVEVPPEPIGAKA